MSKSFVIDNLVIRELNPKARRVYFPGDKGALVKRGGVAKAEIGLIADNVSKDAIQYRHSDGTSFFMCVNPNVAEKLIAYMEPFPDSHLFIDSLERENSYLRKTNLIETGIFTENLLNSEIRNTKLAEELSETRIFSDETLGKLHKYLGMTFRQRLKFLFTGKGEL